MINRNTCHAYIRCLICLLLPAFMSSGAGAQTLPEPTREHLLNGLTVLFSPRPGDPNVFIKMRIESGSAFDLAGKGGTMALLGDVLFPDPVTREYVAEQLGGRLDVTTNHDAIDVSISGRAEELERIVDFLRGALVTPQVTPENVTKIREAKVKLLSERANLAAEMADREIALRLFGAYPYGHPASGTVESVSKIDRPDLMLARERFLNANDATVVVIGGVDKLRVMRALRQLLGPWQRGDRTVPATFRQPNPPDPRVLVIDQPGATAAEVRVALRGFARSDPDSEAASLLALVMRDRLRAASAEFAGAFARHEAHDLPGMFVTGVSVPTAAAAKAISTINEVIGSLAKAGPNAAEFERARTERLIELSRQNMPDSFVETTANLWLNTEIYKLPPASTQISKLALGDMQRVAGRLFRNPVAIIAIGNAEQLKSIPGNAVEVRGAKPVMKPSTDPATPVKKP